MFHTLRKLLINININVGYIIIILCHFWVTRVWIRFGVRLADHYGPFCMYVLSAYWSRQRRNPLTTVLHHAINFTQQNGLTASGD